MEKILNPKMSDYTSFKAGGNAASLVIAHTEAELAEILKELNMENEKYFFLGNGSNTLFRDEGYDGTVVKYVEDTVKVDGNVLICKAGALLSTASKIAAMNALAGMEALSGIPGSVGGAVYMNAGAYDSEIKYILKEVRCVKNDGSEIITLSNEDLNLSYRHSELMKGGKYEGYIVLEASFELEYGDKEYIEERIKDFTNRRKEKQPLNYPSAGSTFKRPLNDYASRLIDAAGLKGTSVGGAEVSKLHAGFVINKGNATATDILDLITLIKNRVYDEFDAKLEEEIVII